MSGGKEDAVRVERLNPPDIDIDAFGVGQDELTRAYNAGIHHWFVVRGVDCAGLPVRMRAALSAENVRVRWANEPARALWAGSRSSFAALLRRWPDEPGLKALGKALAEHLQLPLECRAPTRFSGREWVWGARTYVMGILNVTPDSFSDGGRFARIDEALRQTERLLAEGADIIDVGGESTRPGATPVPVDEEIRRCIPVIQAITKRFAAPCSIDTYKAEVAKAAVEAGAGLVNDITGLHGDSKLAPWVAELGVPIVLMHMQGTPQTMQENPTYRSVVSDVAADLGRSVEMALAAGVRKEHILVDPGFGFGKQLEHNLQLLRHLRDLRLLGYPVLVGTSRKSMIGALLDLPVDDRLEGTAATVALSVAAGADIVRVHDVKAMKRVVRVSDATVRGEEHA